MLPSSSLDARPARRLFAGASDAVALVHDGERIDYAELERRVDERRAQIGTARRLVLITAGNAVEPIVTFLAAVEGRHPVLFVPDGPSNERHRQAMIARFDPDVIAAGQDAGWRLIERHDAPRHEFHDDLAMLASTSGSTGSPKLVRLSFENLRSNAAAIAQYLELTPDDRAATTLPLQYCYGLSVVTSHLAVGASLVLTDRSVAEDRFWSEFTAAGATSFAGVPYTFDLLEASGFADRVPPTLRYITQAGGRMAPDRVRRFAGLGRAHGFDLFVMYGATEATARMAYLPPERAHDAAGSIGRAIPGGSLHVDAGAGDDVGELVYRGPNVMMGYAESAADFALGRTVDELRTGDRALRRPDGMFEIVGRMNRFVKVYGMRVDLDRLERLLADDGFDARVIAVDERPVVFVLAERQTSAVAVAAAEALGIPAHAVQAHAIAEFPRTASGKPDTAALVEHAAALSGSSAGAAADDETVSADGIRALFAQLLGRPDASLADTFTSLGGDSLSYVEMSVRLEQLLGTLPADWPRLTPGQLAAQASPPAVATASRDTSRGAKRGGMARVDTGIALRAVAIVLIVGSHADLFTAQGGAHLLLALFGFNLARFQLAAGAGSRPRRLLRTAAQIAVPAVLWIAAVAAVTGQYRPETALLVNGFVHGGDAGWHAQWQFWFIELAVWGTLGLATLFAWRRADRLERAHPFGFALALLAGSLAMRYAVTGIESGLVERYTIPAALWILAIGWAGARADRTWQRALLSVVTVVGMAGFLGNPAREAVAAVGILILLWVPALRLPRALAPLLHTLAGASLFIYLTHWQVFPAWEQTAPLVGTVLSLAIGIGAWWGYRRMRPVIRRRRPAAAAQPAA